MSRLATDSLRFCTRAPESAESGSALVGTLVVLVGLLGLVCTAGTLSAIEVKESRRAVESVRAKYLAEAGVERGLGYLAQAIKHSTVHDPLHGVTSLFASGATVTPFSAEPIMNGTVRTGAYTVSLTSLEQTSTSITIAIDATGYLPDAPSELPAGKQVGAWHAVRSTVKYSLAPSHVFDYAYFLNNWGWFYGSSIYGNGNVRSNGQFDAAGYAPTVTGEPLYDKVAYSGGHATLSGYQDDNHDGLQDGNDGGIFSGWDIVGAQNVHGNGGHASNQHDFQDALPMPNLSDLSHYEASALDQHSSIRIGSTVMSDAVYGDAPGEKQNLYLVGTLANPIVLNGSVVVRGNVVISGYVTGQGAIYSGGNVYCPNSITYVNKPSTPRPANTTQAATEAWLSTNWDKDFLGLFARENIVVGDPTDSTWQYYVNSWMNDALNQSAEDAGSDGMPNTRAGRDGILGTADDDVLEGDGVFTIEHYTAADQAAGVIPPGKSIGDPIPGTGEDIDGDGVYDPRTTLANVTPTLPMTTSAWGGNIPSGGVSNYHSISNMRAANFDATFYTNHSFCWVVLGGTKATINGALVSRNENIIYGTPSLEFNHDARLLGGASGMASKMLPIEVQPVEILRWAQLDRDPNRYVVSP
jgi:hypothetical protein